jgi:hypothetical protein
MARAFYRSYVHGQRRAGQVTRFHIVREDGKWAGKQALCGTHFWGVTNSEPVIFDPMPAEPPAGLSWCPMCVGHLAERLGTLNLLARELAAPPTSDTLETTR